MHDPVDDSLTKGEVVTGEKDVAKNDGDSSEDSNAKETEDVLPD